MDSFLTQKEPSATMKYSTKTPFFQSQPLIAGARLINVILHKTGDLDTADIAVSAPWLSPYRNFTAVP